MTGSGFVVVESALTTLVLELTSGEICLEAITKLAGADEDCGMANDCGNKDVMTGLMAWCDTGYIWKNLAPAGEQKAGSPGFIGSKCIMGCG